MASFERPSQLLISRFEFQTATQLSSPRLRGVSRMSPRSCGLRAELGSQPDPPIKRSRRPSLRALAKQSREQQQEWIASSLSLLAMTARSFLSLPLVGPRRAKLALGWRVAPGGGSPRNCAKYLCQRGYPQPSNRSLRSRCATLPTSGRDEDRRCGRTVRHDCLRNFYLSRFAAQSTHASAFPRRVYARVMEDESARRRGRGECRVLSAPAASHAKIESIRA
jgi:hypothetical protein